MMLVNLPALLIGLLIGAYWARVIKLVLKTRRLTGKSANFVPPEKLGRLLRIVWYPTVAAWIIFPLIIAFAKRPPIWLREFYFNPIARYPAVAAAVAAFIATLICWRKMGSSWRMGIDPNEKTQLIVSGPYAYVRHPIYALSSLLMIASLVAVPAPAMIIVAIIHLLFLQWEARREERHMLATHGEIYANYFRRVGRFMPRTATPFA